MALALVSEATSFESCEKDTARGLSHYLATDHTGRKCLDALNSEHIDTFNAPLAYLTAAREAPDTDCSIHVSCAQGSSS